MRKFIHKITPSFISAYNERLLKNAPLGWQLQLPTITWTWFLVTILTIPIPFFIQLDKSGDDDIESVILIAVLIAVLAGFLFAYILIQFNNTKVFGRRVFLNGPKEQLAYLYVFMLCMLHIIFYPLIVEIRKGNLMSDEEIRAEAVTYNQASFYFMSDANAYRYFPSDASFLQYEYLEGYGGYRGDYDYDDESNSSNIHEKETYYIEHAKPLMRDFFSTESDVIDPKCTRDVAGCPKLYMINDNHISEFHYAYSDPNYKKMMQDTLYYEKYQLKNKSAAERLKDISNFITLYIKYSDGYSTFRFEHPEIILKNYMSNRFSPAFYETDAISTDYPIASVDGEVSVSNTANQLSPYRISEIHDNISNSKHYKWNHLLERLTITFFVALALAILLFIFKNIRLKEFILTFVYTGLLILAVAVLTVVIFDDEAFAIHVVWIVFLLGIYFSFFEQHAVHYSSLKTVCILLTNAAFSFVPIFMYLYFHEYLDLGKIPDSYEYCTTHTQICDEYHAMEKLVMQSSLWGGIAFYLFIGSTFYKRVYERILALPFAK